MRVVAVSPRARRHQCRRVPVRRGAYGSHARKTDEIDGDIEIYATSRHGKMRYAGAAAATVYTLAINLCAASGDARARVKCGARVCSAKYVMLPSPRRAQHARAAARQ